MVADEKAHFFFQDRRNATAPGRTSKWRARMTVIHHYLSGELEETESNAAEEHLMGCSSCSEACAGVAAVVTATRACQRHFAMFPPDMVFEVRAREGGVAGPVARYFVPHLFEK
jgi:anti-sigma factor RsiW